MKRSTLLLIGVVLSVVIIAAVGTTIDDFFMPGSQPGDSGNIETPDRCDNCHGGYDQAVEPAFNWRGSMMAQAARDPIFYACLAVAEQDAPGVGDMCLRCHTPDGWLNGRCEPTDGSALNNNDREGVQCDFCHKMVKPLQQNGDGSFVNPFPNDNIYSSQTYPRDAEYLATIPLPGGPGNGMYIADSENAKRGPFSDATGRHQMHYSPFHSQSDHCGTCHDVSNPVLIRSEEGTLVYSPEIDGQAPSTSVVKLTFPIERTFSEWRASGYSDPNSTDYMTCQDCHMRDVTGKGAKMKDAKVRDNLPLHDFTGGNTFTPLMVKNLWVDEVDAAALDAGIERARQQLQAAADLEIVSVNGQDVTVKVTNYTGHKLPTGYPEGRRIWINLIAYNGGEIVWESGKYEADTISLENNPKIYHCEPGISKRLSAMVAGDYSLAGPSLHMALNDTIYLDNRIPPKGFTNTALLNNQSPVVGATYKDRENWDNTTFTIDDGIEFTHVEARLMYQTASKEFIEFLTENGGEAGQILHEQWLANGKSTPEVMNVAYSGEAPVIVNYMEAGFNAVTREESRKRANGIAEVHVTSNDGNVSNAIVYAEYSGPSSGTVEGVTDANGLVTLRAKAVNNPAGVWCFTLLDVTHDDYTYVIPKPYTRECVGLNKSATIPSVVQNLINIYPNPFTDKLYFEFSREMDEKCVIEVFDVIGHKLDVVFDRMIEAGQQYKVEYAADKVATDMLFYRIQFNNEVITGKVVKQ